MEIPHIVCKVIKMELGLFMQDVCYLGWDGLFSCRMGMIVVGNVFFFLYVGCAECHLGW